MKIKQLYLVVSILFTTILFAQQPTFNSGQDPKPSGKIWQKIENMSDEFNGTSLNTQKWDNQDPQWKGRQPALFTTNAVSVGGGDLKITAAQNLTQAQQNANPGYSMQGGLVRSKNKTTYGYFETRMKANKTFMSSTFWLINKRNEFSGCDRRVTELDVTENVGVNSGDPSRNWVNQNIVSINANTHSRGVLGNPSCNIPEFFRGDKAPIGEPAYAGYHTYGVYWKSATELFFFLDGQQVFQVVPPADFDLGMYLRMVVETYDWNPVNATFQNGQRRDKMDETLANRTTYYDWTRSWKLVDDPGNNNGTNSTVDCNSLPSSVTASTTIPVTINYTADQNRDVVVELWNATTNQWLQQGVTTVNAGSGTATVILNFATAPAIGTNYQFKASIRPVGASWQQNLNACNKTNISLTNAITPDVDCTTLPTALETSTSLPVSIVYDSDQDRDIVVELWNSTTNQYINQGSTTVSAGSGTANITINFSTAPTAGSNYLLKASIRPVGSDWTQNLDACNQTNVSLTNPITPEVNCTPLPSAVESSTAITVSVDYASDQNRDIVVELWNATTNQWLQQGVTTVGPGTGTANVTINFTNTPAAGSNYQFKASIRPVGADWTQNLDACNKTNITLTGNANTSGSCDAPWTSPNQSITKQTVNWVSANIDISCESAVDISMDIEGLTPAKMEAADYLNIFYAIDGGTQIPISQDTDGFDLKTVSATNISGNNLKLFISGKTSWQDETYNITNIKVVASSGNANKYITNGKSPLELITYPNPIKKGDELNISFSKKIENENITIAIYNYKGIIVQEEELKFNKKLNFKISPKLSNYIYLMKISADDEEIIKRIMIQR